MNDEDDNMEVIEMEEGMTVMQIKVDEMLQITFSTSTEQKMKLFQMTQAKIEEMDKQIKREIKFFEKDRMN